MGLYSHDWYRCDGFYRTVQIQRWMYVWDPRNEMNSTYCDASQAINVKVEEVSDAEEEEGPVPISFPKIKTEPEVRCMSLYVHCKE
jgi:hypothetical protein